MENDFKRIKSTQAWFPRVDDPLFTARNLEFDGTSWNAD
jgi:hypothetical protein